MSYATITDVRKQIREDELIGLTDDTNSGLTDAVKVDSALADASAEIDGYLGGRYTLPLAATPAILKKLCCDIAIYNLYAMGHGAPESRQKLYDNAVAFLKEVGKGTLNLGAADPIKAAGADLASVSGPDRIMGRDGLKDW